MKPIKPELELFKAVQESNLKKVEELLKLYPNIDLNFVPDKAEIDQDDFLAQEQNTALLYALSAEKLEIALLLLQHKADPWKSNEYNLNALHMLMMVNKNLDQNKINLAMKILQELLNNKQITDKINQQGRDDKRSPLALAIAYPPLALSKIFITELMKKGGQYLGEDPIWAQVIDTPDCMERISYIVKESNLPKDLLNNEALIKTSPKFDSRVALQAAVTTGNLEFLNYCLSKLDHTVALEIMNNPKLPALQNALNQYTINKEIIISLIDSGADPEVQHLGTKKTFSQRLKELAQNPNRKDAQEMLTYLETKRSSKLK